MDDPAAPATVNAKLRTIVHLWPIIMAVVVVFGAAVRADSEITEVSKHVAGIEVNGTPAVAVHLQHLDDEAADNAKELAKIDAHLDKIEAKIDESHNR